MLRTEVRLLEAATGRDPRGTGHRRLPMRSRRRSPRARPSAPTRPPPCVTSATGEERVRVMEARAGTGKTFTLAGGPRGLRAFGRAGDRRRLAGPGRRCAPARGRHRLPDGRPAARPDREGERGRHPRSRGDRGGRGLGDADPWLGAPGACRRLALGAPGARRRPRPASLDRRRRRLRRARRPPGRGRADRKQAAAHRAAAPQSPPIWPRGAPPTRSRSSQRAGASSTSKTRATLALRW